MQTTPAEMTADRFRRLDAFLKQLRADIYPEPPTGVHTSISRRMFAELCKHHPPPPGAKVLDVGCGQGVALEIFREAGLDPLGITLGPDAEVCRQKGLNVQEMDLAFLDPRTRASTWSGAAMRLSTASSRFSRCTSCIGC